jgi:gamma-glutamylcyclotransferase (GGCT)/AIG2-like uncharacterized protein YtfP
MTEHLFAYGLLMEPGQARDATLPGHGLIDLGFFPGAVPMAGHSVKGLLIRVEPEAWDELDRIEGVHRGLYVRKPAIVLTPEGEESAQFYLWGEQDWSRHRIIQGGDWAAHEEGFYGR